MSSSRSTLGRLSRTVVAVLTAAGIAVAASPALAGGTKKLDSVLGNIDWGDSKKKVLRKLKAQMMRKLRKRKDLRHDRVKMQRARKRMVDKHRRIKKSYTKLNNDAGYRVSVITDEFTRNNNEALLKVEDDAAQRFYFFHDGAFYKLVVAYKQNYLEGVGFKTFVGQVAKKYGDPGDTRSETINDEQTMVRAIWKGAGTTLKAKNQKEVFGTFSLVFSDRKRVEKMRANNENFGGKKKDGSEISGRVQNLKKGSDGDENAEVVDEMVGEDVNIDMQRNAKLEEQGPTAGSEKKKGKEKKGEVADKGSSDSGEDQAQADQEQQEEQEEQDREFDNLEADKEKKEEDDELIVY